MNRTVNIFKCRYKRPAYNRKEQIDRIITMIINNKSHLFVDEIKNAIHAGSTVKLSVNHFTFNAFFQLLPCLSTSNKIEILLNQSSFTQNTALFVCDEKEVETDFKLHSYYRLNQVLDALKQENIQIKQGNTGGNSFLIIENKVFQFSPHSFTEPTLGLIKDGQPYMITQMGGNDETAQSFEAIFKQLWETATTIKPDVLTLYQKASPRVYPEMVYKYSITKIFDEIVGDSINRERLSRTGFKDSTIWNMLFNFQQDAVLGAIDKIEKYNGCIIADSVGLGKTFEALAIIKYYELRNDRVLVLVPKKLRDNWVTYRLNDKRNVLLKDRLNYDVLNHTDLSREGGMSGDINLETIHWENYDLVVIDESHNFRNNDPKKGKVTRYERLMNEVMRKGVKTKVLMLSATPVNTRLNDLKNQLAFITEGNDQILQNDGIGSMELTLSQAQRKFNKWLKKPNATRQELIDQLSGDYFKLLDIFTISRSRKHVEKYYDVADIGQFPERLKPISINNDFDVENKDFSISDINDQLEGLNLKFYSPMYFLLDHKREAYAEKYDTKTKTGVVFTQLAREENIITLMRVNLLKRLESSIHSFRLTLDKLLQQIDRMLDRVTHHKEFSNEIDIRDLDFDDEELEDLIVGGKVKVLLQDLDLVRFKEFLEADRRIIEKLLVECNQITVERDQKLKDLHRLIKEKINHPLNPGNKKVIVFSAFADTVEYLYKNSRVFLKEQYQVNTAMVTGGDGVKTNLPKCKADLNNILINFSPRSKDRKAIFPEQTEDIDVLFCTDCISEGQNLQDCDYLVNYDIHWNPVRIIQRFGRIDRIGTTNTKVQLVNFYPNLELDQYINLVGRVKGRMQILDISATGDENIIDNREGEQTELDYRRKQLEKMKEQVVDLEDLEGGISISDLTFNDFRVDVDRITDAERQQYEQLASGVFSLTDNNLLDLPDGVLFCLKDINTADFDDKLRHNLLHPYALVFITKEGEIQIAADKGKKALDVFKKLAYGKMKMDQDVLKAFNQQTKSGKFMTAYTDLLDLVQQHLKGQTEAEKQTSIFNAKGSLIGKTVGQGNYEIVSYLIVG